MTRSQRLLTLLDILRSQRCAVTAHQLSEMLGVSARSIYRDIELLRHQGADIQGEVGVGFVLHHDFLLPPLMFKEQEIEALVLGIKWVVKHADEDLAQQAHSALSKIYAVVPKSMLKCIEQNALHPVQFKERENDQILPIIRQALREEKALSFDYKDGKDQPTHRTVHPINVGYFEQYRVLSAWCELRQDFRHFRIDRMAQPSLGDVYPNQRQYLELCWQQATGIKLKPL